MSENVILVFQCICSKFLNSVQLKLENIEILKLHLVRTRIPSFYYIFGMILDKLIVISHTLVIKV